MEKFRFDQYGSVYEYDKDLKAYVFVGKLNGRTQKEFISDLKELRQTKDQKANNIFYQ